MKNNLFQGLQSCFSNKKNKIVVLLMIILSTFSLVMPNKLMADTANVLQEVIVTGIITDAATDEPLPGVTVQVKGTTRGVITKADGSYSINLAQGEESLIFSFIGYSTQEVVVGGRSVINIAMSEEATVLDEVVVTGYGAQKKVSLTGAISSVKTEDLKSIPVPTIAQSLMGKTTGLFIKNMRSQPGDYTGTSYNIRGYGDALIIIDGMEATNAEFLLLDPNDIAQINILKDASTAAVYGARAGNGVILVSTRRGQEGAAKYNYSVNYGLQQITLYPGQVNSVQLAQYENISRANTGMDPKWSQDDINKFQAGNDPDYPNTDWWDLTLRNSAPQTQHNLTVSGGTNKAKYFISGGYYHQESLYRSNDLHNKKYNLRTNLDVALTDKLDMGLDFSILANNIIGPSWDMASTGGHWGIMMMLYRSRPQYPASFPDPTKAVGMGGDDPNPVSPTEIDYVGYKKSNSFTNDLKFTLSYKLPLGFAVKGLINYKNYTNNEKTKEKEGPVYYMTEEAGVVNYVQYLTYNSYNSLTESYNRSNNFNQQYYLTWKGNFGDHNMDAMLVYERLSSEGSSNSSQRIRYEYDLDYLFAGPDRDKTNSGTGWEDGRIGQIFTFNYNFREKYLLGVSARRDGSPKFAEEERWGIFPSVSAAWRISQENFMQGIPAISNLKLRASAGRLGYDRTGNFQYLSTFSIRPASMMVDGVVKSSIRTDALANPYITWEKITTYNVGLDFGLLNNSITGAADIFYRYRSDVLGTVQTALPDVVGASMPQENINEYSNRGLEFELAYNGVAGPIKYQVGGNVSYAREKIEFVSQPEYATEEVRRRNNRIGTWSDQKWGYLTDGVFLSQEEIDNWAILDGKNNGRMSVGDIRIIDYNGDGIVTADDQVVIGRGSSPDIIYALNANITWRNLKLSMLWQGAGLFDISYGNADMAQPFSGGNAPLLEMYKHSYTPENEWGVPANIERYPLYPRYYAEGVYSPTQTNFNTDFYLRKGDYIRLKSLELSYDLPQKVSNFVKLDNVRVYFSGLNLLTFSELKFLDPEFQSTSTSPWGAALAYPPTKTYSFGLVVDF